MAPTRAQSVPRVAKYRHPSEMAIPAARRSVARRRILPGPRADLALFLARGAGESVAYPPPAHQRPQPGPGRHRAAEDQEAAERLPRGVEPQAKAEHGEEKSDGSPDAVGRRFHVVVHDGEGPASARAAPCARRTAVQAERPASTTTAAASTACVGLPSSGHARWATSPESQPPTPRTT